MGGDNSLAQDPEGRFPMLPASGPAGTAGFSLPEKAQLKSDPLLTLPTLPLQNCFPTLDLLQYVGIGKFCFWRFFLLRHLVFSGTGKNIFPCFVVTSTPARGLR